MGGSRSENHFISPQIIPVAQESKSCQEKDLFTRTFPQGCKYYIKSTDFSYKSIKLQQVYNN